MLTRRAEEVPRTVLTTSLGTLAMGTPQDRLKETLKSAPRENATKGTGGKRRGGKATKGAGGNAGSIARKKRQGKKQVTSRETLLVASQTMRAGRQRKIRKDAENAGERGGERRNKA